MATEDELYGLLFSVRRSVRYLRRRSRFFDVWGKVTSGLNVIASSTAIGSLIAKSITIGVISGAVVTLASTIDLVVASSIRARDYSDLARRFIALEAEIERSDEGTSIGELREKRLMIEADEPPILRALDVLCHNELAKAMGLGPDQMYQVGWVKRRLAQFVSFESLDMKPLALPAAPKSESAEGSRTLPS